MTTYSSKTVVCAYCSKETEVTEITSTNAFGPCDLDLRPPKMQRSTIHVTLQVCPHCGYATNNLEKTPDNLEKFLKVFPTLTKGNDIVGHYRLAGDIWRLVDEDHDRAFGMYLRGAWCADDKGATDRAKEMRLLVLEEARHLLAEMDTPTPDFLLRISDIARRALEFDYANSLLKQAKDLAPQGFVAKVIDLEQKLIEAKDTACHKVDEVEQ